MSDISKSEEQHTNSPSGYLAISDEEAFGYLDFIAEFPRRKQICICGHTVTAHKHSPPTGYYCRPNSQECPCRVIRPVFYAENASYFKRSTHGPGLKHALSLGIKAMKKAGHSGKWLVVLKCQVPDCANPDIVPVCVNENRRITMVPTRYSAFLCHMHVVEMGGTLN